MSVKELQEMVKKYDGRVAKLLSLGRDKLMRIDRYSYIDKFGFTKDDVPQLLKLANDMEIYNHDYSDIPEDEDLEFFGVIHSWHILSELEVIEAKELFIRKLEDCDDDEYDDWILSDFRQLIKPFRKDMYEYFVECSQLGRYGVWTRLEYIGAIGDMLKAKEVELEKVDEYIVKVLNSNDNAIVNASVIGICMDEKLTQHHELIQKCFERKAVDIDHIGDLEDVEIEMGFRQERETKKELTEMQKKMQGISDMMNRIMDEEEVSLPFIQDEPKLGRNDPCPCGSGKKYKKCCLNKLDKEEISKFPLSTDKNPIS